MVAGAISAIPTRPHTLVPMRADVQPTVVRPRTEIVRMAMDDVPDTFTLPPSFKASPVQLPQIGVGTLAWGNPRRGWGITFNSTDLDEAYEVLTDAGMSMFDTSEVYGYQSARLYEQSEQLLSRLVEKRTDATPIISTKFMPVPWTNLLAGGGLRIGRQAVVEACRASIARLGVGSVDVYSLHAPLPYVGGRRALYEGLAEAHQLGLCRAVGVCNFNAAQIREARSSLRKLGVPLVSNSIKYSPMNVERELDGTLETCLELGVTPIAHTPLAGGLATGFYAHALARRNGRRGRVGRWDADRLLVLSHVFEAMSDVVDNAERLGPTKYGARPRTEAQVALRFCVAKGCVPVVGINTAWQAREAVAALSWQLEMDELESLTRASTNLHRRRNELGWIKSL